MSQPSVTEPGPKYVLCRRCEHLRPPSRLLDGVCVDEKLCAALKARAPANPPDPFRPSLSPPDWDRIPDPPLIRSTQYHRTKSRELAAVTAYSNGKHGGNGHG